MFVWIVIQTTVWLDGNKGFEEVSVRANPAYTFETQEKCEKRVAWELEYGAVLERKNGVLIATRETGSKIENFECIGAALFN